MSDLATLGLQFETKGADAAAQKMDQIAGGADRAEKATDGMAAASGRAMGAIAKMVASIEQSMRVLVEIQRAQLAASGAAATHGAAVEKLTQDIERASTAGMYFGASFRTTQATMGGAAGAAKNWGAAVVQADAHVSAFRAHLEQLNASLGQQDAHMVAYRNQIGGVGKGFRLTATEGLNFSRQMADIGVTAAMGMNPLMIAIQQGPQLFDIMQQAAVRSGSTIRAVMLATGAVVWTALAPLLPVIAAIALAAGTVAAGWGLATRSLTKGIGDVTEGMNLSEAQMKKLKDAGVETGATAGDAFKALGTTIKEMLVSTFGDQLNAAKKWWEEFLDGATKFALDAVKAIATGFLGTYYAIRDTWKMLPGAIGDIAVTTANATINAVEWAANKVREFVNATIRAAQQMAKINPLLAVANAIPQLAEFDFGSISNRWAGQASATASAIGAAYGRAATEVDAGVTKIGNAWKDNTIATATSRVNKDLGDTASAARDLGSAAKQAADDVGKLVEKLEPFRGEGLKTIEIKLPDLADPLDILIDKLTRIDRLLAESANGLSQAFGAKGRAIGDVALALSEYEIRLAEVEKAEADYRSKVFFADQAKLAEFAQDRANAEMNAYASMAGAAKQYFGEQTAAYKILQGVEMAYRAVQFANAVKAMALDATETGSSIANSLARGAAKAAEAVASIFARLGPWGFPVAAAALAVMASVGVKALGGGGGSASVPTLPTTNDGSGTVLGDPSAQSQSINKSMELAEKYYNRDLSYSNDMLDALRAIEKGIGDVTTAIARQLGIGGKLSTDGLGLGSTSNPGFLGMFSSSRSSDLADQGLNFGGQNLGQIISNGIAGSFYQIVQNTKTKSGFFGIGGGTSTWNTETSSGIDAGLSRDIANLLASLKGGVLSAAGMLGIEGAEAVLNAFQVNIGRISFKDMSSAEIAETLTAVFSAVGDQMAGAIMPTLTKYQAAGEGLMETLSRLAAQYQAVDQVMASLGMTFGAVGVGSIEARDRLVQLAGGLDEFVKSSTFFAEEFLTEAQRMGPIQSAVNAELARLGIATDITREQFANLVMGLDVSTESGAAMYAALMRLAPGLDKVLDYTEGLNGVIVDTAALLQQRQNLEIQLMEAQGRSAEALAAKRVLELAAMDASLRPLQEAIWAAQEAASAQAELARAQQEAADVARQIASQRRNLEIDLMSATGDVAGALAAKRADELAAMDASLRPLQQAIWTAQEAAAAQAELARAQQEAADIARQIASQRRDLEIELMEATGNSAGALAARRADELAAIDASLRPIKEAIWAAQDLAAAQAEATRAAEEATRAYEQQRQAMLDLVETARNDLTQAYQREAAALQETIDKFGGFSDSLRAFRKELDQIGSGSASYASTKAEFDRVAALARLGDAEALGGLQGVSKTFLDAAMSNASSQQAYLRDLALVKSAVDLAADTADRTKTAAERQLEALNASVAGLITLNESVLSVRDAIGALQEAMRLAGSYGITKFARGGVFTTPTYFDIGQMAEAGPEAIMPLHQGPNGLGVRAVNDNGSEGALLAEVRALRGEIAELKAAGVQTAVNTGQIKRQIDRQEVDGVYVRGEAPGDPVNVENAA